MTEKVDTSPPIAKASTTEPATDASKDGKSRPRTTGMWLTDTLIYPLVTNPAVWAVSVAASYLTERGGDKVLLKEIKNETKEAMTVFANHEGTLIQKTVQPGETIGTEYQRKYGWFGEQMAKRGAWLDKQYMKLNVTEKQAQMGRLATFSFLDGCLLEPVTSELEDRRTQISHGIDKVLGTEAKDKSVYDDELYRSDTSLLTGRALALSVVLPTALYLGKSRGNDAQGKEIPSFNDRLFNNPGLKIGERVDEILEKGLENHAAPTVKDKLYHAAAASAQGLDKLTGTKLNKPALFKMVIFEAFYTSICTAGLYLASKIFANPMKDEMPQTLEKLHLEPKSSPKDTAQPASDKPKTRINTQRNAEDALILGTLQPTTSQLAL